MQLVSGYDRAREKLLNPGFDGTNRRRGRPRQLDACEPISALTRFWVCFRRLRATQSRRRLTKLSVEFGASIACQTNLVRLRHHRQNPAAVEARDALAAHGREGVSYVHGAMEAHLRLRLDRTYRRWRSPRIQNPADPIATLSSHRVLRLRRTVQRPHRVCSKALLRESRNLALQQSRKFGVGAGSLDEATQINFIDGASATHGG
mmetsp:Transcript_102810/g.296027  ORF Transcript_102810/g.296027 Transcript_102810/m.296027 type:complete len:205 (-) Transcript_102810:25-639(-)